MGAFPHRPVTTAVELISSGVRTARRLPGLGLQVALTVADAVHREYRTLREEGLAAALRRGRPEETFGYAGNVQEFPGRRAAAGDALVEPAAQARAVGAPGTQTEIVERVEAELADAAPDSRTLDADSLPLPDFDHLTLGSLRARLRRLSLPELLTLREYEKAHADRLQVVTMLDNRIAKLQAAAATSAPSDAGAGSNGQDGDQG